MKKRLLRIGAGFVVVLLIAVAAVVWSISGNKQGKVELWIQSQLLSIANSYLTPQLSFTDLHYSYPLGVSIKNLHLTAPDTSNPGKSIDVIACESASIALAEIPSIGKPIMIEKIALNNALISAIATAPGSKDFIGFSNLIRPGALSSKPEDKPAGAPTKLSDVFKMKLVQLVNGKIVYDPRIPGTLPMALDQINTTLTIDTTSDGWYKLNTVISRKPVFDLAVAGELNLDSFTVRGIDVKMLADLGSDKLDYLPPEVQQLLKQYDGKGTLDVAITGTMPVMDPMKGNVQADVKLDRAHVGMGDLQLPVDDLELKANFADGKVVIPSIKINALGGTADLSGEATLNDRLDADLTLKVTGMVLENLLKAGPGPNAAKLDLDFKVAGSLFAILGQVPPPTSGPLGAISVQNFRLSANDPANPGQTVDVVAVKNLDVALAAPVIAGKPIEIEKLILDEPTLSAIAVAPNSFQFVGVPNLPPSLAAQITAPTTAPAVAIATPHPEPETRTPAPAPKLSDLIRVKTFQLNNAKIVYDPRIPNTQRMWLDHINTSLNVDPANPGLYTLATNISRKPVFDLGVGAKINIDHPAVDDLKIDLLADLTKGQTDFLVPQVQLLLKQSKAAGTITFNASGSVPFTDLNDANLHIESKLANINVTADGRKVPIQGYKMDADLAKGVFQIHNIELDAIDSTFNLKGSVALNDRLDSNLSLHMEGVPIETLLSAAVPGLTLNTQTLLDADVQINAAVAAVLSGKPGDAGQPPVTISVKKVHLIANDPDGNPVLFGSVDNVGVAVSSVPLNGGPIEVDRVTVTHPAIKAVAVAPGSNEFVGISNLQKIGAALAPATQPVAAKAQANSGPPAQPAGSAPKAKLSDLFRVGLVQVDGASVYYDPKIAGTVPMSLDQIAATVKPTSQAGDTYAFHALIPHAPDFNLSAGGNINVNTLVAEGITLMLGTDLGQRNTPYLPPQLQKALAQYAVQGTLNVSMVGGIAPLTDPLSAELSPQIKLDNLQATASGYTIPVSHVRLAPRVANRKVVFQPTTQPMGGPTVDMFGGSIDLLGTVNLDDQLHSTLDLGIKGLQLKPISVMQTPPNPALKDLTGSMDMNVHLQDAPLLVIAAHAAPPSTQPSAKSSPLASVPLPDDWGSGRIELTEARLAGFELIQKFDNFAKSAFYDAINSMKKNDPQSIAPKEYAQVAFNFTGDTVNISRIHYSGELIDVSNGVERNVINLNQTVDLTLHGSPLAKLGTFLKSYTNSLIKYHIFGPFSKVDFKVETGDGQPIKEDLSKLTDVTETGIEKGTQATTRALDTAGGAVKKGWNKIFGGGK